MSAAAAALRPLVAPAVLAPQRPVGMDTADLRKVTDGVKRVRPALATLESMKQDRLTNPARLATETRGLAVLLTVLLTLIGGFPSRSHWLCSTSLQLA